MAFYLGAAQLALHRIAARDATRYALTGVYVDPARGVAAASDGRCLVEIAAPVVKKFPAGDHKLANGEAKPFVLAAKSAQALAKLLTKGKTADDPAQYAAFAAAPKDGQPASFLVTDGKLARPVAVETIDGSFPDYRSGGVFPASKPLASVNINAALLRDVLAAVALGDTATLHVLKDRLILLSKKGEIDSRAVVMGIAGTVLEYQPKAEALSTSAAKATPEPEPEADEVEECDESEEADATETPVEVETAARAAKAVAPAPVEDEGDAAEEVGADEVEQDEVETEPEPVRHEAPARATFRRRGGYRRFRRPSPDGQPTSGPTPAQRAFHAFLIRSRGGDVTVGDLSADDVSARIDALKAQPEVGDLVATWPQWRKLFLLLADQKATPQETCDILNGLDGIQSTSSVIAERLSADSPAKAAA